MMRNSLRIFERRLARARTLGDNLIRTYLKFCKWLDSRDIYHGVLSVNMDKRTVDHTLNLYVTWLNDAQTNPSGKAVAPTMARPLLCAAIFWNRIFGQNSCSGTNAWSQVKKIETRHLKGEPLRLKLTEFKMFFQSLAKRFHQLKPPFSSSRQGTQDHWDCAGITAVVFSCLMTYRSGNVLDYHVSPDEHEAPLETFITYDPDHHNPQRLIFQTAEKCDKKSGEIRRKARRVVWNISTDSAMLDPVAVIDLYLEAVGQTRETRCGAIRKRVGNKTTYRLNSMTQPDFRRWLGQLSDRGIIEPLSSIPGDKKLGPAILRRTTLSFFAEVASLQEAQALAGHASCNTTANYYCGFHEDELAQVRVGLTRSLLILDDTPGESTFFTLQSNPIVDTTRLLWNLWFPMTMKSGAAKSGTSTTRTSPETTRNSVHLIGLWLILSRSTFSPAIHASTG